MRHRGLILAVVWAALAGPALDRAHAAILISIDKSTQQMTVEVNGETRFTWPVSTGRAGYATPSGNYRAFRMEKDHFSREWDDAPRRQTVT